MAFSRRRFPTFAAAVATVAVFASAAAPAGAWLRDFEARADRDPLTTSTRKTVSVVCPGGKRAIGSGAFAGGVVRELALSKVWVDFGSRTVLGAAAATDTQLDRWSLESSAWCVAESAVRPSLATGAPYVKDVTIVRSRSAFGSEFLKGAFARCPAGSTAIGGGFQIAGANMQVAADRVDHPPGGARNAISAAAHETDASAESWAIEADAICANITTAVSTRTYAGGRTRFSTTSPSRVESVPLSGPVSTFLTDSRNRTVVASCPPNQFVVGGGATVRMSGTGELVAPNDVALTMSRPGGGEATSSTWVARAVEVDPTPALWQLQARAVCTTLNGIPAP
jgi:hypothetical protein